jgi:hypothetical protein
MATATIITRSGPAEGTNAQTRAMYDLVTKRGWARVGLQVLKLGCEKRTEPNWE